MNQSLSTTKVDPYTQLVEALLYIEGRCDGADSESFRSLARQVRSKRRLAVSQQERLAKSLAKYEPQLKSAGYLLPSLETIEGINRPPLRVVDGGLSTPLFEGLNEDQKAAAIAIVDWAMSSTDPYYVLTGGGGTGKSFAVQQVAKTLQSRGKKVCFAAPSHQAAGVLREMALKADLAVDCETIHSLLWLSVDYSETGEEIVTHNYFKHSGLRLTDFNLVVMDECSMIGRQLWRHIEEQLEGTRTKILFMGDPAQLPPVREKNSPTFAVENRSHLTQIMRYRGAIAENAAMLRDNLTSRAIPKLKSGITDPETKTGVFLLSQDTFLSQLKRAFQSDGLKKNPDHARAIAWTNRRVDYLNSYIRSAIYGRDAPAFIAGERLIAKTSVVAPKEMTSSLGNTYIKEGIVMQTASKCTVVEVLTGTEQLWGLGIEVYRLLVIDDLGDAHTINLLHENSRKDFDKLIATERRSIMEQKKECDRMRAEVEGMEGEQLAYKNRIKSESCAVRNRWRDCHKILESFGVFYQSGRLMRRLGYTYALTSHSAQGSTFTNVFVDAKDINKNKKAEERNQCLYVAVTRASDRVLVLQ